MLRSSSIHMLAGPVIALEYWSVKNNTDASFVFEEILESTAATTPRASSVHRRHVARLGKGHPM